MGRLLAQRKRHTTCSRHQFQNVPGCVRTHLAKERDVCVPFDVHVVQISNRTKINILLHRASELYDLESDGADDDSFGPTAEGIVHRQKTPKCRRIDRLIPMRKRYATYGG